MSMHRLLIVLLLVASAHSFAHADEEKNLESFSPPLREFLKEHSQAKEMLISALDQAVNTKSLEIYYYYSEDASRERAYHLYPNASTLVISVRENQLPIDQFFCFLFEALNAKGEPRFKALFEDVKSTRISREDFPLAVLKIEFSAQLMIKKLIQLLPFTEKEKADSYFYGRVVNAPDDFDSFLLYLKKVSPNRHPIEDYKIRYDLLLRDQQKN
jgi:hypothetical protein